MTKLPGMLDNGSPEGLQRQAEIRRKATGESGSLYPPKWVWDNGHWWVRIKSEFCPVAGHETPGKNRFLVDGFIWLRYDDLCAAFPGFKEITVPGEYPPGPKP